MNGRINESEWARETEIEEKNFPDARKMSSTICKQVSRMGPALSNEYASMQPSVLCTRVCTPPPPSPSLSLLESFASRREEKLIRRYFCPKCKETFFSLPPPSPPPSWNEEGKKFGRKSPIISNEKNSRSKWTRQLFSSYIPHWGINHGVYAIKMQG